MTIYCMVHGSIKKLSSIGFVNIYFFPIFFSIDFAQWKMYGVTPHFFNRDSLTLMVKEIIKRLRTTDHSIIHELKNTAKNLESIISLKI